MNKYFYSIIFFVIIFVHAHAQVFPVELIRYSAPPNECLNIVIMGDGYTSNQQDKFIQDATNATNGFLSQQPFAAYSDSINVFAVKVVSNVSGAAMDPNQLIDNYFGSSFWSYGIERLLVAWNYGNIVNVLNENVAFYDEAVIMVNDSKYGGSGGDYAVFSTHSDAIELMLHEFGHSFSDLADEYWAGSQYANEKTNMTQNNNPSSIKWKDFLYVNGVGIYPHEESPNWYRPHQSCKMRYLGVDYCDVCADKISRDIQFIANTDTLGMPIAYFAANNLNVAESAVVEFYDFSTNRPNSWEWTFEGGSPETSHEKNPVVTYETAGKYSVSLKVINSRGENTSIHSDYIQVNSISGIMEFEFSSSVSLFPNPANDLVTISNNLNRIPLQYRVLDLSGKVILTGLNSNRIDISTFRAGLYILQIDYGNVIVVRKLIKE